MEKEKKGKKGERNERKGNDCMKNDLRKIENINKNDHMQFSNGSKLISF